MILSQIAISVIVVALYHFLVLRRNQPGNVAPPIIVPPPIVAAPPPIALVVPIARAAAVPAVAPVVPSSPVAPVIQAVSIVSPAKMTPAVETTPPEIVAVIAAAIAVVLGRPHRVLSVQQGPVQPQVNVWAMEGRVEQFMSHRVR